MNKLLLIPATLCVALASITDAFPLSERTKDNIGAGALLAISGGNLVDLYKHHKKLTKAVLFFRSLASIVGVGGALYLLSKKSDEIEGRTEQKEGHVREVALTPVVPQSARPFTERKQRTRPQKKQGPRANVEAGPASSVMKVAPVAAAGNAHEAAATKETRQASPIVTAAAFEAEELPIVRGPGGGRPLSLGSYGETSTGILRGEALAPGIQSALATLISQSSSSPISLYNVNMAEAPELEQNYIIIQQGESYYIFNASTGLPLTNISRFTELASAQECVRLFGKTSDREILEELCGLRQRAPVPAPVSAPVAAAPAPAPATLQAPEKTPEEQARILNRIRELASGEIDTLNPVHNLESVGCQLRPSTASAERYTADNIDCFSENPNHFRAIPLPVKATLAKLLAAENRPAITLAQAWAGNAGTTLYIIKADDGCYIFDATNANPIRTNLQYQEAVRREANLQLQAKTSNRDLIEELCAR